MANSIESVSEFLMIRALSPQKENLLQIWTFGAPALSPPDHHGFARADRCREEEGVAIPDGQPRASAIRVRSKIVHSPRATEASAVIRTLPG